MNTQETQRRHFNKIAKVYVRARSNRYFKAYQKAWWNNYFPLLLQRFENKDKVVGLDAMCGKAEVAKYFVEHRKHLKMRAFDYSEKMVLAAKKYTKNVKPKIQIWQADITKLKTKEKYDFVVILGGLHHIPSQTELVLANIHKVLKQGGYFLNLEPTQNNFLLREIRKLIYHLNPIFEESSEKAFDLPTYNQLLAKNGFKVWHQSYPGLLGYILFYNPDAFPLLTLPYMWLVKTLVKLDLWLSNKKFGKYWSFATWTLAKRV